MARCALFDAKVQGYLGRWIASALRSAASRPSAARNDRWYHICGPAPTTRGPRGSIARSGMYGCLRFASAYPALCIVRNVPLTLLSYFPASWFCNCVRSLLVADGQVLRLLMMSRVRSLNWYRLVLSRTRTLQLQSRPNGVVAASQPLFARQ